MAPRTALAVIPLLLILSGCVGTDDAGPGDAIVDTLLLSAAATPLWNNPQDFPHPAYNYPTLTNPAVGAEVPAWWAPINATPLPSPVTGVEHLAGVTDIGYGAGMALFGSLAVVPGMFGPMHIVDISDPTAPVTLSEHERVARGAAIIPYPNGTLVAVLSTDNNIDVVMDITDPRLPKEIFTIEPTTGSHKVAVVPGTPILYNANSNGGGSAPGSYDPATATGVTEIFDLTDPWNPVHVQDFPNGYGCHHIYFHVQPAEDYYRALCAGIEMTQIWDIADPLNPVVLVNIPVHHGSTDLPPASVAPLMFSHSATFNDDHTVLIVGDETGGGLAPGCDARVDAGMGPAADGPFGNLWFYDVSDELHPELLSWLSPQNPLVTDPPMGAPPEPTNPFGTLIWAGENCTSHHGRLIPDETRDLLAWAFYGAGVVVIDFTNPAEPHIISQFQDSTNTWEVWYYNGYLFTGDLARGLDVLSII